MFVLIFTLQPSQVMAPKWYPDDGDPHTLHGILDISFGIFPPGHVPIIIKTV